MKNSDSPSTGFATPNYDVNYGLTKREYFAGLAMQGILAEDFDCLLMPKAIAAMAVDQADALLKALEVNKP